MKVKPHTRPLARGVLFLSIGLSGAIPAEVVMKLDDMGKLALSHHSAGDFQIWSDWSVDIKVGLISRYVEPYLVRSLAIDFNGDGQNELLLSGTIFVTFATTKGTAQVAGIELVGSQNGGSYGWAFVRDQIIGPDELIRDLDPEGVKWTSNEITGGGSGLAGGRNIQPSTPGLLFQIIRGNPLFLGVRFRIEGNWHYGWVMVMGNQSNDALPIAGWAYETEPGKPISAGPVLVAAPAGPYHPTAGPKNIFPDADTDASGALTITEFSAAQPFGSKRTTAIHRFRYLDLDGDGLVTSAEFIQGKAGTAAGSPSLSRSFLLADHDHDGLLQAGEWPLWHASGTTRIQVMAAFDRMDRTGEPRGSLFHGSLTPQEFGIPARSQKKAATRFADQDDDGNARLGPPEFIAGADPKISVAWVKDLFRLADVDRNGWLSPLEFAASDQACPPPSGIRLFMLADGNRDGFLDPVEFSDSKPRTTAWSRVMIEFTRIDRNRDGRISISEYREAATSGGPTAP